MSQSKQVPSRAPGLSFQTAYTSAFPDLPYAPTQKLPNCSNQKPWSHDDSSVSSTSHIHWDRLKYIQNLTIPILTASITPSLVQITMIF